MISKQLLIRLWSFRDAPRTFRALFPDAKSPDWIANVPKSLLAEAEAYLLRWQQLYPIRSVELADGKYCSLGSAREKQSRFDRPYGCLTCRPTLVAAKSEKGLACGFRSNAPVLTRRILGRAKTGLCARSISTAAVFVSLLRLLYLLSQQQRCVLLGRLTSVAIRRSNWSLLARWCAQKKAMQR